MKVVQVVGARPQFIKLAPVSRELRRRAAAGGGWQERIAHTGQHYDAAMSAVFFAQLGIPEPAVNLNVGSGSHGAQTARMLEGLEAFLLEERPDAVVIYGDTNSTVAGALAAAKLGIRLLHVEAGLRSFNRAMPEELNRVVADHLSDVLLAPTAAAMTNLGREGLATRARLVGDVMYDAVAWGRTQAATASSAVRTLGLERGSYGIATIHRAENTGIAQLRAVLATLESVAREALPLVWPVHPRTRALLGSLVSTPALRLVDPQSYLDMLALVDGAAFALTDSGGLQKEAFILGVPCVTMRTETEWLETVAAGANAVAGIDAVRVLEAVAQARDARARADEFRRVAAELYGAGHAAARVVEAIEAGG
jgi:UDP-N-acetylglucosamine 2-epimerase